MTSGNNTLIRASIGVMAYNEEQNIGRFLDSLFSQHGFAKLAREIIIISSGSTDKTNKIILSYARKHKKIKFLRQTKRLGKASAVNLFIENAKSDILILVSADLILQRDTIKKLLAPFKKKTVGITGVHPIPVNNQRSFMGFTAHLQWQIHHQISLKTPKMGEMIAFRKIFRRIPASSLVDEANIEPLIRGQGYKAVYCESAIVFNKGPETIREFLSRRRTLYYGHIVTKQEYGYSVSTLSSTRTLAALVSILQLSPRYLLYTLLAAFLETTARILGFIDYKFKKKNSSIWKIAPSTKNLITPQ